MKAVLLLATFFGSIILVVSIMGFIILSAIKLIKGDVQDNDVNGFSSEEAQIIEEVIDGLSRMEERIKTLEAILMDSEGDD